MNNPCPKRILCPAGTGSDSGGFNYSSEHVDVPEFEGRYYPPTDIGTYTACVGRCQSTISQADADLCAQRLGKICLNATTNGKPTYGNTPQICTIPGTGKTVIVPADVFVADSQAEANAQALSYANGLQVLPTTPPVLTVPPPTTSEGPPSTPNTIPTPTPQPTPHPPPPSSHCLPCDDTGAVSSFTKACDVPADTQILLFESPPLKCGQWRFQVTTVDPGSVDDGESYVTLYPAASNPARTPLDWSGLEDCSAPFPFINPCSPADCSAPRTTLQWGLLGCCSDTTANCKWLECQTLEDGSHWMPLLIIQYSSAFPTGNSEKKFTVTGTLINPLPIPPSTP